MGMTPFFVNMALNPLSPGTTHTMSPNLSMEEFTTELKGVHDQAKEHLEKVNDTMKKAHNRRLGNVVHYEVKDKVMLDGRNITTVRPTKKFTDKWYGLFDVIEKVGAAAYKLKLLKMWKVHPVFNKVSLKPYTEPVFEGQKKLVPLLPELIDGEEEYEVKEVIDSYKH